MTFELPPMRNADSTEPTRSTSTGPPNAATLSLPSQSRENIATTAPASQNGKGRMAPPSPITTIATLSSRCPRASSQMPSSGVRGPGARPSSPGAGPGGIIASRSPGQGGGLGGGGPVGAGPVTEGRGGAGGGSTVPVSSGPVAAGPGGTAPFAVPSGAVPPAESAAGFRGGGVAGFHREFRRRWTRG